MQSSQWSQLLSVNCHPDMRSFLCSMFAPECVPDDDRLPYGSSLYVFPCRSLCEAVRRRCELPMSTYNYEWPEAFNCDRFARDDDHDICIQPTYPITNSSTATTSASTTTTTTTTTVTTPSTTTSTASTTTTAKLGAVVEVAASLVERTLEKRNHNNTSCVPIKISR